MFLNFLSRLFVERMLNALIKFLENKHLNPGILEPLLATKFEKNQKFINTYNVISFLLRNF